MPKASPASSRASIELTPIRSWRLLSGAIRAHDDAELSALLREGADPNARENPKGASPTPLHLACLEGSASAVKALLGAGARPDALSRGSGSMWAPDGALQSAACAAMQQVYLDARQRPDLLAQGILKMELLIQAGLSPESNVGKGRCVWGELLAWEGAPLPLLLPWIQAGADIDAFDSNQRTLLFNAICHHKEEEALRLTELGADPFLLCCDGRLTPAQAAASYKGAHPKLLRVFEAISERRSLGEQTPQAPSRASPSL